MIICPYKIPAVAESVFQHLNDSESLNMSGWGCPHEVDGKCQKVLNRPCDIGMKGCVLAGRFRFADPGKNRP